jgi:ubiquinone/menaquinone biosynthesis C-methylase UbiE
VEVKTADMRQMPFADGAFDVVVSTAAIHNLYQRADREKAIAEIARVLKPGGRVLISDIRHHGEYAAAFRAHGFTEVSRVSSALIQAFWAIVTFGNFQPATLLARKPGG